MCWNSWLVSTSLSRVREVKERGLLRDEQFDFRPKHSTTLQLARLVEIVNRIFEERRLTGAVFLVVANAFDAAWIKGLLYKLTILNFKYILVKTIPKYLGCRTFLTPFQSATSTGRFIPAGTAQGELVSLVLFSLYVNYTPTPFTSRSGEGGRRSGSRNHVSQSTASCLLPEGL
jgi:hypothetical protein